MVINFEGCGGTVQREKPAEGRQERGRARIQAVQAAHANVRWHAAEVISIPIPLAIMLLCRKKGVRTPSSSTPSLCASPCTLFTFTNTSNLLATEYAAKTAATRAIISECVAENLSLGLKDGVSGTHRRKWCRAPFSRALPQAAECSTARSAWVQTMSALVTIALVAPAATVQGWPAGAAAPSSRTGAGVGSPPSPPSGFRRCRPPPAQHGAGATRRLWQCQLGVPPEARDHRARGDG